MNNPIRWWGQKHVEFRLFKRHLEKHNIDLRGKSILDAGCGSGYGAELISREFNPSRLMAFDYMPEQIERAEKRSVKAEFFVGDVREITLPSDSFDAVFVFGVLHHVPQWKKALYKIARVLAPKGVLLVKELSNSLLRVADLLGFYHPAESRFEWPEFENALDFAGFNILEKGTIIENGFHSFLCMKQ